MRPELLELNQFGSFSSYQKIDFSSYNTLFLISGKTGAGKSTLFDAMLFALYGRLTGTRDVKTAASTDAELTDPYVAFTFSAGPKKYRVKRTLSFYRKKKRGEGLIEEQSSLETDVFSGGKWEAILHKNSTEANLWLEDLLGLTAEEFEKIVLIPQGEFQSFLESPSREKYDLLCRLFPVEQYEKITERFRTDANARRAELKSIQDEIAALEKYFTASGYKEKKLGLEKNIEVFDEEIQKLESDSHSLFAQINETRRLSAQFQKSRSLQAQLAKMDTLKENFDSKRRAYSLALSLIEAASIDENRSNIEQSITQLTTRITTTKQQKENTNAALSEEQKKLNALHNAEESIQESRLELHSLRQRLPLYEKKAALEAQLKKFTEDLNAEQRKRMELTSQHDTAAAEFASLKKNTAEKETLISKLAQTTEALAEASILLDKWHAKRKLTEERNTQQQAHEKEKAQLEASKKHAQVNLQIKTDLENKKQGALLANLAENLRENEACPLCGSFEHPSPANSTAEAFTEDELLETAQKNLENSLREQSRLEERAAHAEERISQLTRQITEIEVDESVQKKHSELEQQKNRLKESIEKLEAEVLKRNDIEKKIEDLQEKIKKSDDTRNSLELTLANKRAEFDHIAAETTLSNPELKIRELEKQIEEYETHLSKSQKKTDELQANQHRLESTLDELSASLTSEKERLKKTVESLLACVSAAGLKSVEEARKYFLTQKEREKLQKDISEFDNTLLKTQSELEALMCQLEGKEEKDESALVQSYEALKKKIENIRTKRSEYEKQSALLEEQNTRHARLSSMLLTREKDARLTASIAEELTGRNSRNIDFQTFVTASYLEKVILYANERMKRLSSGQYIFKRRDEKDKGQTRSGLQLDIIDIFNGTERDTRSLSGGEKFLAALSLALGLSDVVMSESGGIKIESLFIDEGFGSLDEEALERAVEILEQVKEDRMTGIISHVKWLRDRIPDRIDVVKRTRSSAVIQSDISHNSLISQKES